MLIRTDVKLSIATATTRNAPTWKNRPMLWSDFVKRISKPHRTAVTYNEYIAAKPDRQSEIKDVGGYVGGYLAGGQRSKTTVSFRQLITLDIDKGTVDFWDTFTLMYGCAAAIYSTHKHSPTDPRYRLLIPLDREVKADEYQAISRYVAGVLNIELFDPTTFQPSRLMYWPACASDGVFYFNYQDGPILSADRILSNYVNWKDSSEWPISLKFDSIVLREIKKQVDPLEKPGLIGAFCRSYTISEAIEKFLKDYYKKSDKDDRYTYAHGSTEGGLVVYEDKFAYSHHGSDPTSDKLSNAFDLVRVHLFAERDENSKRETPSNKLPSFKAMQDFCAKDGKTRILLGRERFAAAVSDFDDLPEEDELEDITASDELEDITAEKADDNWLKKLDTDLKTGVPFATIQNIVVIAENDPKLKGCFTFNDFTKREIVSRNLPWRKIAGKENLTDTDESNLRNYLERVHKISNKMKTDDAMRIVLGRHSFNPVKDYLDSLQWDGVERLDTIFIDYLGAEDSEYTRTVTRKTFVGAIARVYEPGIEFQYMTVLVGPQGAEKSRLIRKMAGEWFSDSFTTMSGKESFEQLHGAWIVEVAELAAMKKSDVELVKLYVAKTFDKYRPAFARRVEDIKRSNIFIGTSNTFHFLKDSTGGRRFWPVTVSPKADHQKSVSDELTEEIRFQLWAEAKHRYQKKEKLYLSDRLEEMAREKQTEHSEVDDRSGYIRNYLDTLVPVTWYNMTIDERRQYFGTEDDMKEEGRYLRSKICVPEIWYELFGSRMKDLNKWTGKELFDIMSNMKGWKRHELGTGRLRFGVYGPQVAFVRTSKTGIMLPENDGEYLN